VENLWKWGPTPSDKTMTFGVGALDSLDPAMSLAIVHQTPNANPAPAGAAVWRTCLREVVFVDGQTGRPDMVEEDAAYGLLLEIICGLRSPLVGETQVQGQFKTFLAGLDKSQFGEVKRLGQRLLADAGDVRERHLRALGARSYGSVVRRRVEPTPRVAVIGTGALAEEILPFVATGHIVDQWGRRPAARPYDAAVSYRTIADADAAPIANEPTTLVVAAPVGEADLAKIASRYANLQRVIDLRGDADVTPIPVRAEIVPLASIFADGDSASDRASVRVDAALDEIKRRSRAFALREELHPFGWEDLCA